MLRTYIYSSKKNIKNSKDNYLNDNLGAVTNLTKTILPKFKLSC